MSGSTEFFASHRVDTFGHRLDVAVISTDNKPLAVSRAHPVGATLATLLLGSVSLPAPAQAPGETPAKPAVTPAPVVREIVVTGSRPAVENRIDRKVYAISSDLQADIGSVADVLRNLPSVTVDIDGNPSLRGDDGVQILIDGRLAPEFNGANRGAALQQLGAANIDRIEVITNPPANFKRDGSTGIINIVTKRQTDSHVASARASVGSAGRYIVSASQGAQLGDLNLHGSATLRRDPRERHYSGQRITRNEAGTTLSDRRDENHGNDERMSKNITLGADYDLGATDRLSAEGSYYRRDADTAFDEQVLMLGASGSPTDDYHRIRRSNELEYSSSGVLRYHHPGENDGDGLTISAERSEENEWLPWRFTTSHAIPPQPAEFQHQDRLEHSLTREFSVDYVATREAGRKLVAGYDLQRIAYLFDFTQTVAVEAGGVPVPDPVFSNVFRYDQTIHALYGSYERPFGRWTVLAGLRLEQARLDNNQLTTGEHANQDYFRVYPSLHFAERLNEEQALTFSYSRRVSRPEGSSLNPFQVQVEPFSLRQGNPDLKPSESDAIEAGWSYEHGQISRGATLYARRSQNVVSYITTPVGPNVVLTSLENVGENLAGGLELVATGRLLPQLDYNFSGNVYYNEIDAGNLGFAGTRSTYSYEAKAALNWRAGANDTLQINIGSVGKRLTPQGFRGGSTTLDLGFRHKWRPNFSLTATVSDLFASRGNRFVTQTPELSETTSLKLPGRIVYVGVSWSLAGAKQNTPDDLEYE